LTYQETAAELAAMLAEGTFPYTGDDSGDEPESSPRVGDGILRLDAAGIVTYASPNAVSAYRRLGRVDAVVGQHVSAVDRDFFSIVAALEAGEPVLTEVESGGAVVQRRLLPLLRGNAV